MQKTISLIVFTSIVSRMRLIIAHERAEDSKKDQEWYQYEGDWQYDIDL